MNLGVTPLQIVSRRTFEASDASLSVFQCPSEVGMIDHLRVCVGAQNDEVLLIREPMCKGHSLLRFFESQGNSRWCVVRRRDDCGLSNMNADRAHAIWN